MQLDCKKSLPALSVRTVLLASISGETKMTLTWALLLGFGLGLRHATDADHVVAVGTLLRHDASPVRAARVAVLWGLGHTLTFFGLGILIVAAGVRVPLRFERVGEGVVAAMLIGLGTLALRRSQASPAAGVGLRPVFIGVVHGLAGSAGIALLALATIPSTLGALVYLALFGVGTVAGMVLLTAFLSFPLGSMTRTRKGTPRLAVLVAAVMSIGLGASLGYHVLAEVPRESSTIPPS